LTLARLIGYMRFVPHFYGKRRASCLQRSFIGSSNWGDTSGINSDGIEDLKGILPPLLIPIPRRKVHDHGRRDLDSWNITPGQAQAPTTAQPRFSQPKA